MNEVRRLRSLKLGTDITIKVQHSEGSSTRRFMNNDTWEDLINYIGSFEEATEHFTLSCGHSSYMCHAARMDMTEPLVQKLSARIVLHVQWDEEMELDESKSQTWSSNNEPIHAMSDLETPRSLSLPPPQSPSPPPPFVYQPPSAVPSELSMFDSAFEDSDTENTRTLRIRRNILEEDMMAAFADENIMERNIRIDLVGETAVDDGGVFKDILTQFWGIFMDKYFEGETQAVPLVLPQCDASKFQALGRILVLGFQQQGYFPLRFSEVTLLASLFGKEVLTKEEVLESFYKFLGEESKLLKECMPLQSWDEDQTNDLVEVLARYGVTVMLSPQNLCHLVHRCAAVTLLERPLFGVVSMGISGLKIHKEFQSPAEVRKLYAALKPTNRKVVKLLTDATMPSSVAEQRVFEFLVRAVRTATEELLLKFLRFVTGSDAMLGELFIQFVTATGLSRRIVAHTCTYTIDLPVSYTSYNEFLYEFKQQMNSNDWTMDFA